MKPRLLIVYASRYGQTARIARRIAAVIDAETPVVPIAEAENVRLEEYDALIVAGGVYFGRHEHALENWVRRNIAIISTMEAAFVSVSGGGDERYVHEFSRRTGWVPEIYATFKGGQPFTKYGFFLRLMIWAIARREGARRDMHTDYDFTDWDAVDRFARDFVGYAATKRISA